MNNAFIVVLHLVVLFDLMFLFFFLYQTVTFFFILISLLIFCYFHNLFFITLFESLKHMIDK
jgi:hypothetical protein